MLRITMEHFATRVVLNLPRNNCNKVVFKFYSSNYQNKQNIQNTVQALYNGKNSTIVVVVFIFI